MANKYAKHYELLIAKAKARGGVEGYSEIHHIVPRSMGGADVPENIAELTGREHYVAHLLLHKMNPDHAGMAMAVLMMTGRGEYTGRTYELLKRSTARVVGEKTGDALRGRPKSEDHKAKMSAAAFNRDAEHLEKIAEANRGRKNTSESKARMSKAALNRSPEAKRNVAIAARDPERRAKLSAALKGKSHEVTEETRQKISQTMKGKKPANLVTVTCPHCGKQGNLPVMKQWHFDNCGKGMSEERKQRIREKKLGTTHSGGAKISAALTGYKRPRIECPHCGKVGANGLMKRWHFDNCKQR